MPGLFIFGRQVTENEQYFIFLGYSAFLGSTCRQVDFFKKILKKVLTNQITYAIL